MSESREHIAEQWWLAPLADTLVWARLRVLVSGAAEVFGANGETLHYVDADSAQMALLDAEFRAFDGIDDDDAALFGFDLGDVEPPDGGSDEELLGLMTEKFQRGDGE